MSNSTVGCFDSMEHLGEAFAWAEIAARAKVRHEIQSVWSDDGRNGSWAEQARDAFEQCAAHLNLSGADDYESTAWQMCTDFYNTANDVLASSDAA